MKSNAITEKNEKANKHELPTAPAIPTSTEQPPPVDFETAMLEAGFGKFNWLLLLASIPATFGANFETSNMSFILPVAECDLQLSLIDKGVLNASTYAGMIISAIIWGYVADTKGRRGVLLYGFLANAVCVFGSALSQNFQMLVFFKFMGGFIVNGPGAVLFTYLSELHDLKQRPRVLMLLGMVTSSASLVLPLLAWAIFPRAWNFTLFNYFDVHPWQIFLAVCGIPSLVSGFTIMLLPESPKFLMSQGRNAEALQVFQKIYALNKNKPRESFPYKVLVEEVPNRASNNNEAIYTIENKSNGIAKQAKREHKSTAQAFKDGMQQMKPMFRKPILGNSLHAYTMQFCILFGLNTIRLWLPQLFASMSEYESQVNVPKDSSNLCTILEFSVNQTAATVSNYEERCNEPIEVSMSMYINNIIVALAGLVGYFFAGGLVRALGAKNMLVYGLFISAFCGFGLYWSTGSLMTLIISSVFITITAIATSSLLGLLVMLFPTTLRTIIVAIAMMFGRLGALSGNMLFPIFVEWGCLPPFIMVGSVLLCAAALSCLIPDPKKISFS